MQRKILKAILYENGELLKYDSTLLFSSLKMLLQSSKYKCNTSNSLLSFIKSKFYLNPYTTFNLDQKKHTLQQIKQLQKLFTVVNNFSREAPNLTVFH